MLEHSSPIPPTLVSLILCEQIIDDRITNKKSAIGLFNMILVPTLPVTLHQMVVLASLTEIEGQVDLELRLIRDTDNAVLFRTQGPVKAPSPLATVDLVFRMQGIKIPVAGQYAFEVLFAGELLSRRRFQVLQHSPGGQPPGEPQPGE